MNFHMSPGEVKLTCKFNFGQFDLSEILNCTEIFM